MHTSTMPEPDTTARRGRRVVFWSWIGLISVGLSIMIIVPLTGN